MASTHPTGDPGGRGRPKPQRTAELAQAYLQIISRSLAIDYYRSKALSRDRRIHVHGPSVVDLKVLMPQDDGAEEWMARLLMQVDPRALSVIKGLAAGIPKHQIYEHLGLTPRAGDHLLQGCETVLQDAWNEPDTAFPSKG